MKKLFVIKAKPNPFGKDRLGSNVPATQLAGEWVDFTNNGTEPYDLRNIVLQHLAYTSFSGSRWERVSGFSGVLQVGRTVRVHSGDEISLALLPPMDIQGADHHTFTGQSYVWNNAEGDTPRLIDQEINSIIDYATYDPYPSEGEILDRMGNKLI